MNEACPQYRKDQFNSSCFLDHGLSAHQIVRSSVAMTAVIPLKIAFT
jgi:hypothetical protein